MGNSQCVPHIGGERVDDFLRRLFKGQTNNADELVMHALRQEQKQRQKEEKKRKGIWKRIKKKMKTGRRDVRSDVDLLEALKPQENEYTEARRLHENSASRREKPKTDDPYSQEDFEKWRNHQENVITSIKATMADRREGSILYQTDTIPAMSTSTPRHFLYTCKSPIFQYHSRPKFNWGRANFNRRSIREIARDTPAPWTHRDYGSASWEEEYEDNRKKRVINILSDENDYSRQSTIVESEDSVELESRCDGELENENDFRIDDMQAKWRDDIEYSESVTDLNKVMTNNDEEDSEHHDEISEAEIDTPSPVASSQSELNAKQEVRDAPLQCEKLEHLIISEERELRKDHSIEIGRPTFAKKVGNFFASTFRCSKSNEAGNCSKLQNEDEKLSKRYTGNARDRIKASFTKPEARKAEAFFFSFDDSENRIDSDKSMKKSFARRFTHKMKEKTDSTKQEEEPARKAEALFMPAAESTELDSNTEECANELVRNITFKRKKTKYGTVEHNNLIKLDNEFRKNKLENATTKVDSWKINEGNSAYMRSSELGAYEPAPTSVKYGSVAHNKMIQKGNALRKIRIENTTTKVDSWKINEEDNSYLHSNMKNYQIAPKPAMYGSVAHNNQTKKANAMRKKKLDTIQTTLDTWKTKEPDYSYIQHKIKDYVLAPKQSEYGSVEYHNQIKENNAMRNMRLGKIQSTLDTWNVPNRGSKYSLQRRDEWEPVLDHRKFGTAAHFHQIKGDNAMRQKRLSQIKSNLDTRTALNSGSRYSMKRRDEWEPVYDTRKYGSVAHFHQVKGTHVGNRHMIRNASTKLNTWQPKSKMKLLHASNQKPVETSNPDMKRLKSSMSSARTKIDTGRTTSADHKLPSWSRYDLHASITSRPAFAERQETPPCRYGETSRGLRRSGHY